VCFIVMFLLCKHLRLTCVLNKLMMVMMRLAEYGRRRDVRITTCSWSQVSVRLMAPMTWRKLIIIDPIEHLDFQSPRHSRHLRRLPTCRVDTTDRRSGNYTFGLLIRWLRHEYSPLCCCHAYTLRSCRLRRYWRWPWKQRDWWNDATYVAYR